MSSADSEAAGPTMLRGSKVRIRPNKSQAQILDLWRRRTIPLWNLLCELEQAAYSGENRRSKLGWRKAWGEIVTRDSKEAERVYLEGKQTTGRKRADCTWAVEPRWIKEPGEGREEEREALKTRLDELKKELKTQRRRTSFEFEKTKAALRAIAPQPTPLDPALLERIAWTLDSSQLPIDAGNLRRLIDELGFEIRRKKKVCDHTHKLTHAALSRRNHAAATIEATIAWLTEHGGVCDCAIISDAAEPILEAIKQGQPRLLWGSETTKQVLQKLMALLKQHPQTAWIGTLHSHAAQKIVSEMVEAVAAMLREKAKRASGVGGRDTGFPKFKAARYAAGSIYFANTQCEFDEDRKHVKLSNGIGSMRCDAIDCDLRILDDAGNDTGRRRSRVAGRNIPPDAKLMGGRVWREGEKWFLSCQWELPQPTPLPKTERTAGVKIAASVLLTTFDDRGQTREYFMPPPDKKLVAQHRIAGKKLSRVLDAQKKKQKKIASNGHSQRRASRLAKRGVKEIRPLRLKRTRAFFQASARLAKLGAAQRNARDDFLHKMTTELVHKFDAIAVQKMQVAELMKKPSARLRRREARKLKPGDAARARRDLKPVRKLLYDVAPSRCLQLLAYKFRDLRGPDAYQEIDKHDVNASACSSCGTVHAAWKDGRRIVRCNSRLPDGSECGTVLPRNRNAARLTKRELGRRKAKSEVG